MSDERDDINDDVTDVTDEHDQDDDTDTDNAEWTPPTKEEWEALWAKRKKADSEAAMRKRWLREAGIDPQTGKATRKATDGHQGDEDDGPGTERAPDAAALSQAGADGFAKGAAVSAELGDAGVSPRALKRVLKLLDLDAVHLDGDGSLDGLDEQLADLREEWPELFKVKRKTTAPASDAVGAGRKTTPKTTETKTWEDVVRDRFNSGKL